MPLQDCGQGEKRQIRIGNLGPATQGNVAGFDRSVANVFSNFYQS